LYRYVLTDATFHQLLLACDCHLADTARGAGCKRCNGVVHSAHYWRKPRGRPCRLAWSSCRLLRANAKPKEARAGPAGAGHRKRDLGEAAIGRAVPGKALVQDHDALGLAVPLPCQDGSGLEAMAVVALCRVFVSIAGPCRHLVKEPLGVPVEIAKAFGLQAIGNLPSAPLVKCAEKDSRKRREFQQ
jgi:hypothetical protein